MKQASHRKPGRVNEAARVVTAAGSERHGGSRGLGSCCVVEAELQSRRTRRALGLDGGDARTATVNVLNTTEPCT